eukprot:5873658-Prymnesium_polylepis.1
MLDYVANVDCVVANESGPRVGVVTFSGPPIGCNATASDPGCSVDISAPVLLNLSSSASMISDTLRSRPSSDRLTCMRGT